MNIKKGKGTKKFVIERNLNSERHNVFSGEIHKIALYSNDDKRMQSIDSMETYAHGISKCIKGKKEKIKCVSIIKQYKNV